MWKPREGRAEQQVPSRRRTLGGGMLLLAFATCGGREPHRCRVDVDRELDTQVRFAWRAVVDLLGERPAPVVLLMARTYRPTRSTGGKVFGVLGGVLLSDSNARPYQSVIQDRRSTVFHEAVHVWVGNHGKECWEEGLATAISSELGYRHEFPRSRPYDWYARLADPLHELLVVNDGFRYVRPALHHEGCEGPSLRACFDIDRFISQFPEQARADARDRLATAREVALDSARIDGHSVGYCPAPR